MSFKGPSANSILQVNSPIIIGWGKSTVTEIKEVDIEVFIWDGLQSAKPATPVLTITEADIPSTNTEIVVDIAPFLQSEMEDDLQDQTTIAPTAPVVGSARWVQIDYTVIGEWNAGNSVDEVDFGSSNIFMVTNGQTRFVDGVNATPTSKFLVPSRTIKVSPTSLFTLPLHVTQEMSVSYIFGGVTMSGTVFPSTDTEDRIQYIPAGVHNVQNFVTAIGGSATEIRDVDHFIIRLKDTEVFSTIEEIRIDIEHCHKHEPMALSYINRWGQWDTMPILGNLQEGFTAQGKQFRGAVGSSTDGLFSYSTEEHTYRNFNKMGRTNYTVHTGWVNEDNHEAVRDLLMSPKVYLVKDIDTTSTGSGATLSYTLDAEFIPVLVDTNSASIKTSRLTGMIDYTFNLTEANDYNNIIF